MVLRNLHGGKGAKAGRQGDEVDREVDRMGGSKGEDNKGNVTWAEVIFGATNSPHLTTR